MTASRTEKGNPEKVEALGLLGLARRAGGVALGTEATRKALRANQVHLVLVTMDASSSQVNRVRRLAEHRKIPMIWISDRARLGQAVGAAPLTAVGVTTRTFATQLLRRLRSADDNTSIAGGT